MSEWEVDGDRFGTPATKGDVAMLALYVNDLALIVSRIAQGQSVPENSKDAYFRPEIKNLRRVSNTLDDMQRMLVGKVDGDA